MTVARLPSTPPPLPTLTHHPTPSHHSPPLLLLRRPRPRRLVADPSNPTIPTTTAGDTSDVLRLMDALNLPVSDDTYAAVLKESTASPAAAATVLRHMAAAGRRPGTHLANRLLVAFVGAGAPLTMATSYLEVTPAAVVDTPEDQSLIPIMNEMNPDGLFFHEDFVAYSPFDFSNGSSGASPWLQPDPCIGLDINLSFDEFL